MIFFKRTWHRWPACRPGGGMRDFLKQKTCYKRGSPYQDPAGNRTTRRPPDHRTETQAEVVWSCVPFIRSSLNHLARHSERGKKTRQTGRGGKPTSGNGQAWSQKKRWKDNIRKLTGKEFAMSQRAVKNRSKWRKLVAKLYVVPLRPSLLRDRSDDGRLLPWGRLYIFCRVRESKPRRQRGGILRKPIYVPCTTQYTFFFFFFFNLDTWNCQSHSNQNFFFFCSIIFKSDIPYFFWSL